MNETPVADGRRSVAGTWRRARYGAAGVLRVRSAAFSATVALVLLAGAYLLSAAMRAPQPWSLQLGVPGDTRFSGGFYLPERSQGQPFRWSGPGARLVLHGADGGPLALALRLNGDQLAQAGNQQLRLVPDQGSHAEGALLAAPTLRVETGWRTYHVLLPPASDAMRPRAYVLDSATHRPGPNDGRDLGVALSSVSLHPLEAGAGSWLLRGWPLHPRALALVWGQALLGLALVRSAKCKMQNAARAFAFYILHFALITALLIWARSSPATLAWALPPLPWALGLASVALAAGPLLRRLDQWSAAGNRRRWCFWGGLALLVAAQALLNAQALLWLGIPLALLALALLLGTTAEADTAPALSAAANHTPPMPNAQFSLAAIFLLAFVLRFVKLGELPYGLWRDEARHGLVALRILEEPDYRPVYVAGGGVNMPALIFYPFALAIKLWGIHPWSMRPVTALAGALTVLPLYGLARRLFGARVGLLAALLLAVSSWHITVSRFSFPTVFDPLFGLLGLWLLAAGLQELSIEKGELRSSRSAMAVLRAPLVLFLAGVCFGLAIQTYHTGRVVPLVAGVLFLALTLPTIIGAWQGDKYKVFSILNSQFFIPALAVALGLLLAAGPMLLYALRQQDAFNDRVSGVFLLSEPALRGQAPLAALDETLGRHLLLWNVRGDENGRHAPPGIPGLDFISGLGFLLGCALALRPRGFADVRRSLRARHAIGGHGGHGGHALRGVFVVVALGLSLLPSALAVDAPHGMRAVGGLAFACILAALGLEWLWRTMQAPGAGGALSAARRALVPAACLLLALALNVSIYFFWMRASPAVWVSFYPVHTQVGAYMRALHERGEGAGRQVYVAAGVATNPVFVYLTHGIPVRTFSDAALSEPARPGALFLLSGYSAEKDRAVLAPYLGANPAPVVAGPDFPDGSRPSFVGYEAR
jgi:hypothetical protein